MVTKENPTAKARGPARCTEVTNKEFNFILTAADSRKETLERTVEEFRGFLDCLDGACEKGMVYGTGAWGIGDIQGNRAMRQACEMGKWRKALRNVYRASRRFGLTARPNRVMQARPRASRHPRSRDHRMRISSPSGQIAPSSYLNVGPK